jgi:hypothetical protein
VCNKNHVGIISSSQCLILSGNVEISGGSNSFLKDESAGNEKIVDNFNLERETLVLNWPMVCRYFSW